MMKHWKIVLAALSMAIVSIPQSHGHGGGLNQYGCHRQNSDNTYHCHSGLLDGRSFSSEQAMIDAFNLASGNTTETPTPDEPTGYNRNDYMTSWLDASGNCRNTRHEVLARQSLVPPTFSDNGCTLIAGLWWDPFTAQEFTNPSDLDIDHMVPLAEAHISGAWQWPSEQKRAYTNDLLNYKALIAVSASANRSKGSRDIAQWLPPNTDYHCDYVKTGSR